MAFFLQKNPKTTMKQHQLKQRFRSLSAAALCAVFFTGCYTFHGNEGVYENAWFETDLQGAASTWPTVAVGSEFTINIELWDWVDDTVYDVRCDDSSVMILDVETKWSLDNVAHIEATARAGGSGTAWIKLYEGTLPDLEEVPWDDWEGIDTSEYCDLLVDKAPMDVASPTDIEIDYGGLILENRANAVMAGQTAPIQTRLRDSEGTWLGYDSLVVDADLGDGQIELTEIIEGMITVEAVEAGDPVDVEVGYGDLSATLTVRPIEEIKAISTEVARREDSRTEFEIFVAMTSTHDEIVLNPDFEVEVISGPVDYLLQHPDRILVGTEDRTSLVRIAVASGGEDHQFEVRSTSNKDADWEDAAAKVANRSASGCSVGRPSAQPGYPAMVLAMLWMLIIARKVGRSPSRRPNRRGTHLR